MSNAKNNETKASAAQPERITTPDGTSKLPDSLPDFPTPISGGGGGDPGTSSAPMPK